MKLIALFTVLLISITGFAKYPGQGQGDQDQDQDQNQQQPYPPHEGQPQPEPQPPHHPECSILGDWTVSEHICSSGAIPADNFFLGRDSIQAHYGERHFRTTTYARGCTIWSEGYYEIRNHVMNMNIQRAQSNCGPVNIGPSSYNYQQDSNDEFTLTIGPFNGGVCPAGDLLINTFTRN